MVHWRFYFSFHTSHVQSCHRCNLNKTSEFTLLEQDIAAPRTTTVSACGSSTDVTFISSDFAENDFEHMQRHKVYIGTLASQRKNVNLAIMGDSLNNESLGNYDSGAAS